MRNAVVAFLVLAVLPLRADTFGDVRAAVKRLVGHEPIRGTLTIEEKSTASGRYANDRTARTGSAEVSHDGSGVSVTIPQGLVDQMSWESRSHAGGADPDRTVDEFRPATVIEALSYRDALLGTTDGAKVVEDKRATWHGRQVRALVLELVQHKKKGEVEIGSSETHDRLALWVGDDGIPLAAERKQSTTAGFMMFKGSYTATTSYAFAVVRDHLVLARVEQSGSGSGMGQKIASTMVQTLVVK